MQAAHYMLKFVIFSQSFLPTTYFTSSFFDFVVLNSIIFLDFFVRFDLFDFILWDIPIFLSICWNINIDILSNFVYHEIGIAEQLLCRTGPTIKTGVKIE